MINLTNYVYQDGDNKFYFDSENYANEESILSIGFEDGDMIKWIWEGKKMFGTLREEGRNLGLFSIENVTEG
jgi:hypothetical protein